MGARLRREIARLKLKLVDAAMVLPERLAQRRRDRDFPAGLRLTSGRIAARSKVAILVLWQPDGLAASALTTCRHLVACGYAPLVVSNAALDAAERDSLAGLSWTLVERENIGHDFGAYRDGIRLLQYQGARLERLVLLNDSIWFPLLEGDDLLVTLETAPGAGGFSGAAWFERPRRRHQAHWQSYFLTFGPTALEHPGFARFWNAYPASSRRDSVLKRGEKGLSRAMAAAGLC